MGNGRFTNGLARILQYYMSLHRLIPPIEVSCSHKNLPTKIKISHQKTWPKHDSGAHTNSFLKPPIDHKYKYNVDRDLVASEIDYCHGLSTIAAAATKIVQKSMP